MNKAYTFNDVNIIPKFSDLVSRDGCDISTKFCGQTLSIPIVPSNMQAIIGPEMLHTMSLFGGIGIMHRFNGWKDQLEYIINQADSKNWEYFRYAASVGVNTTQEELDFLYSLSILPSFIVIDVAHGHHIKVEKAISTIRENVEDVYIVAGNVATGDGALFLAHCGADAIKVGVGNGSLCETRIRTGVGIPQLTAIMDVARALDTGGMGDVQILADGGVETPGDVAKALAAGADLVMSGSFFSGTKETPMPLLKSGDWLSPTLYKQYMGSASFLAKTTNSNGDAVKHIEGNAKLIPYKGTCTRILQEVENGLKSSLSYVGANNLQEFRNNVSFVLVTPNGTREAKPYLLG